MKPFPSFFYWRLLCLLSLLASSANAASVMLVTESEAAIYGNASSTVTSEAAVKAPALQILISESEAMLYGGALSPVASDALREASGGGPQILVIKPDVERLLQSPLSMRIMMVPSDGASIAWDSLKLTYGSLRFDITERFLGLSKRTDNGFAVEGLSVPSGIHRLLFSIRDSKQRLGVREFVLRIGEHAQ